MSGFENKFRDKIDSFRYDKEPTDDQVNDFFARYDEEFSEEVDNQSNLTRLLKIAAAVMIFMGAAWISWTLASVEELTRLAEIKTFELPDGSVVTLNAESSLSYNRIAWMLSRDLDLEGEGFFEVTKGSNFAVNSQLGKTEVLGTSFNIYSRGDSYEVRCVTGKVSVLTKGIKSILTPGDQVALFKGQLAEDTFDIAKPTWRQGEYHYDNVALADVLEDLKRTYGLQFNTNRVDLNKQYSGYFPTNNQKLALRLVLEPFGFTYQIVSGKVIVSSKND